MGVRTNNKREKWCKNKTNKLNISDYNPDNLRHVSKKKLILRKKKLVTQRKSSYPKEKAHNPKKKLIPQRKSS